MKTRREGNLWRRAAAVACAFAIVGLLAAPAQGVWAQGEGFAFSHGSSYTANSVSGGGNYVYRYSVSHGHVLENVCQYKGKVWGTLTNGSHHSWTSVYNAGCTPLTWARARSVSLYFMSGTSIYGQAYEAGVWLSGIPSVAVQ